MAARLLGLWVRIPCGSSMSVCCECGVLSGRGLCDELITRPEEYYRLWCVTVCDLETLQPPMGHGPLGAEVSKQTNKYLCDTNHKAPNHAVFSTPLSRPTSQPQTPSSAPQSRNTFTRSQVIITLNVVICCTEVKTKAIPLRPWTVPEGYSRSKLPDFKTIGT